MMLGIIAISSYFFYKKKEDEGFCWGEGRRLNDDELYQAAFLNLINFYQQEQRENVRSFGYCEYAENCKIWMIKSPLSIKQIKQKMKLSLNKSMANIIEIFNMQPLDQDFILQNLQQNNNGFTLVNNIGGARATFDAYNCCEVVTVADIAQLKIQYQNVRGQFIYKNNLEFVKPEKQSKTSRYLRYTRFESGIYDAAAPNKNGLLGIFNLDALQDMPQTYDSYFPLSSCGKILSN